MPLSDQQLRQELLNFGETVPPITQRNREQLRARLEVLRSRPRSPAKPSSTHRRSNTSTTSRSGTRQRLIELSDSEAEISPSNSRASSRSPTRKSTVPTRSVAVGRDTDRGTPISSKNVTADVEQSIARHRREIEQLINSARERSRSSNLNFSSSNYEPLPPPATTPFRPNTHLSRQQAYKPDLKKPSQPSWFNRTGQKIKTFWKTNRELILNILKSLIVGSIIGAILIFLVTRGPNLIPHRKGITCTPDQATDCEDMVPIINTLKTYLQTRIGEVECGFRPKHERYVTKSEINKFLDEKGYKFENGTEVRWNTLINYIIKKPVDDILIWKTDHNPPEDVKDAAELTATEGIHSFGCRTKKIVNNAMQHLAWITLGTSGFLALIWLAKRHSKQREENEKIYKGFIDKIIELLENQYEEHKNDPETKPWLAISHIRDMLIPPQDRKRLKVLWERAKKQISESESRVRSESQLIHGEEYDVWRWIQPRSPSSPSPQRKKRAESPSNSGEENYVYMPPDVGLTECLKLRNFFDPDTPADDDEIDLVVDNIQNRCATIRSIEHIGIHSYYVYLKFSSKEAAAQGFHLLNNWKYHGREVVAKYLRLERYYQHFPEARNNDATNN